jgi:hypothetical protein
MIALLLAAPDVTARLAALETAVKSAQSAGDNAWMLTSAATRTPITRARLRRGPT